MNQPLDKSSYSRAIEDFRNARQQAALEQILSRILGRSAELLDYEQVRQTLRLEGQETVRELREIPLDSIVGSVGRYTDFTRSFLPKKSVNPHRWADIKIAVTGLIGLPPIEVYQIGEVYFVLDGNHRVSVARQVGAALIEAYVTVLRTSVALPLDTQPDDLILKAEYSRFLEKTHLDILRPEVDLSVTEPGQYPRLEEHIAVHRYYLGLEQKREISEQEAIMSWYDNVYLPVVAVIRHRGILREFPGRTETDLYLWTSRHRGELIDELGWAIEPTRVASALAEEVSPRFDRVLTRFGEWLLDVITPDELSMGPEAGLWRQEQQVRRDDCLFGEILVPVRGDNPSWQALRQAGEIARREKAVLRGLHVIPAEELVEKPEVQNIQDAFHEICKEVGVPGDIVIVSGKVSRQITSHARWTDLVVLSLQHPPLPEVLSKLSSGLRTLLHRCAAPVLAIPELPTDLRKPLLAYDGSLKADESLFVAAYLACNWDASLMVLSVGNNDDETSQKKATGHLEQARSYLETHGIKADYMQMSGSVADAILATANEHGRDLIIMGSYSSVPLLEIVMGSTVDEVLRKTHLPVLICQ